MLGDFFTRCLLLVFGYAYPAFECFKAVEKNKVEIEQLRFWCQYWILVAILSVGERLADIFISWLPMYGEAKLVLFIYLWYPKTKGTDYVYGTFVRPLIAKHETEIDRKILELRARSWDLAIYYWQNFAHLGQAKFFEILYHIAGQSSKFNNVNSTSQKFDQQAQSDQYTPGMPTVATQVPSNEQVKYHQGMPANGVTQPSQRNHITEEATAPLSPSERLLQTRQRLRRQTSKQQ